MGHWFKDGIDMKREIVDEETTWEWEM